MSASRSWLWPLSPWGDPWTHRVPSLIVPGKSSGCSPEPHPAQEHTPPAIAVQADEMGDSNRDLGMPVKDGESPSSCHSGAAWFPGSKDSADEQWGPGLG